MTELSPFQEVQRRVMKQCRLSRQFFAQEVRYVRNPDCDLTTTAHVRRRIRHERDDDSGTTHVIEVADLELDRDDIPDPPDYGTAVYLGDCEDERAFLFAYQGRVRPTSWRATFERRRLTARGTS